MRELRTQLLKVYLLGMSMAVILAAFWSPQHAKKNGTSWASVRRHCLVSRGFLSCSSSRRFYTGRARDQLGCSSQERQVFARSGSLQGAYQYAKVRGVQKKDETSVFRVAKGMRQYGLN